MISVQGHVQKTAIVVFFDIAYIIQYLIKTLNFGTMKS